MTLEERVEKLEAHTTALEAEVGALRRIIAATGQWSVLWIKGRRLFANDAIAAWDALGDQRRHALTDQLAALNLPVYVAEDIHALAARSAPLTPPDRAA